MCRRKKLEVKNGEVSLDRWVDTGRCATVMMGGISATTTSQNASTITKQHDVFLTPDITQKRTHIA